MSQRSHEQGCDNLIGSGEADCNCDDIRERRAESDRMATIKVNGVAKKWRDGHIIDFGVVVSMSGLRGEHFCVTWVDGAYSGRLTPSGNSHVFAADGLALTVEEDVRFPTLGAWLRGLDTQRVANTPRVAYLDLVLLRQGLQSVNAPVAQWQTFSASLEKHIRQCIDSPKVRPHALYQLRAYELKGAVGVPHPAPPFSTFDLEVGEAERAPDPPDLKAWDPPDLKAWFASHDQTIGWLVLVRLHRGLAMEPTPVIIAQWVTGIRDPAVGIEQQVRVILCQKSVEDVFELRAYREASRAADCARHGAVVAAAAECPETSIRLTGLRRDARPDDAFPTLGPWLRALDVQKTRLIDLVFVRRGVRGFNTPVTRWHVHEISAVEDGVRKTLARETRGGTYQLRAYDCEAGVEGSPFSTLDLEVAPTKAVTFDPRLPGTMEEQIEEKKLIEEEEQLEEEGLREMHARLAALYQRRMQRLRVALIDRALGAIGQSLADGPAAVAQEVTTALMAGSTMPAVQALYHLRKAERALDALVHGDGDGTTLKVGATPAAEGAFRREGEGASCSSPICTDGGPYSVAAAANVEPRWGRPLGATDFLGRCSHIDVWRAPQAHSHAVVTYNGRDDQQYTVSDLRKMAFDTHLMWLGRGCLQLLNLDVTEDAVTRLDNELRGR